MKIRIPPFKPWEDLKNISHVMSCFSVEEPYVLTLLSSLMSWRTWWKLSGSTEDHGGPGPQNLTSRWRVLALSWEISLADLCPQFYFSQSPSLISVSLQSSVFNSAVQCKVDNKHCMAAAATPVVQCSLLWQGEGGNSRTDGLAFISQLLQRHWI